MNNLMAEAVADIENVDRELAIGRNDGGGDAEARYEQRPRDFVEQTDPVAAFDLDHGGHRRGFIVEDHSRARLEGGGPSSRRAFGENRARENLARGRFGSGLPQACE